MCACVTLVGGALYAKPETSAIKIGDWTQRRQASTLNAELKNPNNSHQTRPLGFRQLIHKQGLHSKSKAWTQRVYGKPQHAEAFVLSLAPSLELALIRMSARAGGQ